LERISLVHTSFIKQVAEHTVETGFDNEYPEGFVTIADVEHILGAAREFIGADFVGYLPAIRSTKEAAAWYEYSQNNIGWLEESWKVYFNHNESDHDTHESRRLAQDNTDTSAVHAEEHDVHFNIWRYQVFDEDGSELSFDSLSCPMGSDKDWDLGPEVEEAEAVQDAITAGRVTPYFPEQLSASVAASMSPIWASSPPSHPDGLMLVNFNLQSDPTFSYTLSVVDSSEKSTIADVCSTTAPWVDPVHFPSERYAMISTPVFDEAINNNGTSGRKIVGHVFAMIPWLVFFDHPQGKSGEYPVTVVVGNDCHRNFAMTVHYGVGVEWIDPEGGIKMDRQDFEDMKLEEPLAPFAYTEGKESCASGFFVTIYPSAEMEAGHKTNKPIGYAMVVLLVFLFTVISFIVFDCVQQRRQKHIVATARRQNLLVSALFPKKIQEQLLEELRDSEAAKAAKSDAKNKSGSAGLRTYLEKENEKRDINKGSNHGSWCDMDGPTGRQKKAKPIADLFPETTIMFADLVGFTAWSSQREPSQVFILLESIYREFDLIAKRRRVFKVETIGDCYVAVCGLPDPRKKHALVMAKFARDCMDVMAVTVRRLELELGPDTSELRLRAGLHSGPVVAGVLRGDKSRFQLFGDTMNTASRMESTGIPNRIQISQDTADILTSYGKEEWLEAREDKVETKGKGFLNTYFLTLQSCDTASCGNSTGGLSSAGSMRSKGSFASSTGTDERNAVSIDWTVEVLANILKSVVARRQAHDIKASTERLLDQLEKASVAHDGNKIAIDELCGYVTLPAYDDSDFGLDGSRVSLDDQVLHQLRDYVQSIAELYNSTNPFHNFDHANHVVLSVNKLLSRINSPDFEGSSDDLYMHTFGITSDPLTWFSVILSALLHDVDHQGVSNAQLLKEKSPLSFLYRNKSVAEQNSFDIGWDLLMEDQYKTLRRTIYSTTGEFKRFRQLTLNAVLATDVFDKDLKKDRQERWDKAFDAVADQEVMDEFDIAKITNMKASIVIEHLIQASDVAHTMQHWHIYRKWNEKLYMEMYKAYKDGRMEKDPTEFWYQGEIGFFDHYIIPLAGKLKVCGVFGVSSAEYLNYAEQNRAEWEKRGERIVKDLAKKAREKYKVNRPTPTGNNKERRRLSTSIRAQEVQQNRMS
jgi:class 3 adenylate cyclase